MGTQLGTGLCLALFLTAATATAPAAQEVGHEPAHEVAEHAEGAEDLGEAHSKAAAHHHELGHGNPSTGLTDAAEIRTDLAVYTFLVFCLLMLLLWKLAWPKIAEALAAREKAIEAHLAAAEAQHEEARRLLAEHEAKMATAADEVRELLEEARRDAEHTKAQIIAEARGAAEAERLRAVREVEIARDAALKQLAETSANSAIALASSAMRQNLSPEQQNRIVRDALGMFGNGSSTQN